RLTSREVVRSSYSSKYFVHNANLSGFGRHERAHLGHEHNQGGLSQKRRFSSHIGPCDDHDLLLLVIQEYVIGHVLFAQRKLLLDHGMSSFTDVQLISIRD